MFKPTRKSLAATLFILASSVTAAYAVDAPVYLSGTLTFDGLIASGASAQVPDGYGGFNWGDSFFATTLTPTPVVGPYVALTSTGTSVVRSDFTDFYFDGADFWSRRAGDANGSLYFYLMHDGAVVFDGREGSDNRMNFNATPTFMQSGYSGPIDYLAIVFQQGGDDYDHLAMDNFQFRALAAPVPEPSAYMLMAVGLGLVGWGARWRGKPAVAIY